MTVVVVGAGLAGAATAWRLGQAGIKVVLVESVAPAHGGGSSHGSARIFRHAYPDPFYVDLTLRALEGWRELEQAADVTLITTTGGLDLGPERDLGAIHDALESRGVPHETLDAAAAQDRWPHLAVEGPVLHQPDAGVIDSERAVQAMVAMARAAGAEVLCSDPVDRIEDGADDAMVRLRSGRTVHAEAVVVAVGAWLPELRSALPPAIADRLPELRVTQQQVFHFRMPQVPRHPTQWPVFVDEGRLSVYSLPGGRDADGVGFKIAEHDRGSPTTASGRSGVVDPASRERIVQYVRTRLPHVVPEPYAEASCLYTSTRNEDFVIDTIGRVVVCSPCSGHGAKFAPVIGAMVARAALGDASRLPTRFRFDAHEPTSRPPARPSSKGSGSR